MAWRLAFLPSTLVSGEGEQFRPSLLLSTIDRRFLLALPPLFILTLGE
jgi:hypothetical protein